MDYGFAPGNTPQDGRARNLFVRRANSKLVSQKSLTTVRGFVSHLRTSASVTRPIDDALIGAHASSEGFLFITMFPGQDGSTTYETLEESIATAANSIAIDDTVIGYSAGDPITHSLHFKGCNIGKAPIFLDKFREALGGNVMVTAPKHFHHLYELEKYGTFEYMGYEFSVQRKTPFATRQQLLDALDAGGFTFIDGSAVPTANWAKWVPKKIAKGIKLSVYQKLGVTIGDRKTLEADLEFRVKTIPFNWEVGVTGAPIPGTATGRQAIFETSLKSAAHFQDTHPYPFFKRIGLATIDEFLAGHSWTHTVKKNTIYTVGTRVEYTVLVPIVDMTTGNLVFNFHPIPGKPYPPVINLDETDNTFFGSV